jgi:hypothetical protein
VQKGILPVAQNRVEFIILMENKAK